MVPSGAIAWERPNDNCAVTIAIILLDRPPKPLSANSSLIQCGSVARNITSSINAEKNTANEPMRTTCVSGSPVNSDTNPEKATQSASRRAILLKGGYRLSPVFHHLSSSVGRSTPIPSRAVLVSTKPGPAPGAGPVVRAMTKYTTTMGHIAKPSANNGIEGSNRTDFLAGPVRKPAMEVTVALEGQGGSGSARMRIGQPPLALRQWPTILPAQSRVSGSC